MTVLYYVINGLSDFKRHLKQHVKNSLNLRKLDSSTFVFLSLRS